MSERTRFISARRITVPSLLALAAGFLVGLFALNTLALIVATVLFSLAMTRIAPERRRLLGDAFTAIAETSGVLIGWIISVLPVAAFALAFSIGASSGLWVAGSIGWFILGLCVLLVLCLFALYPFTVFLAKVRSRDFAQAVVPAQTVAAGTRSSLACLPALLEGAEEHLTLASLHCAGVPVQALVVLKVADAMPDILKTVLNVTADLSVATIIARFSTQQVPATAALASR